MTDLRDIRRREDLPPLEKALSDALDEYLVRLHDRITSWASPVEFQGFLAAEGLVIVSAEDLDVVMNQGDEKAGWSRYSDACNRLRAALPEGGPRG